MNELSDDERVERITAPFVNLEGILRQRREIPHYDVQSLLALLTVMLPWIPALIGLSKEASWKDGAMIVAVVCSAMGGCFLLWSLATDVRRFARTKGARLLADQLAPLSLTSDELEDCLSLSREQGFLLAKYMGREELEVLVNLPSAQPGAPKSRDPG